MRSDNIVCLYRVGFTLRNNSTTPSRIPAKKALGQQTPCMIREQICSCTMSFLSLLAEMSRPWGENRHYFYLDMARHDEQQSEALRVALRTCVAKNVYLAKLWRAKKSYQKKNPLSKLGDCTQGQEVENLFFKKARDKIDVWDWESLQIQSGQSYRVLSGCSNLHVIWMDHDADNLIFTWAFFLVGTKCLAPVLCWAYD